MTDYDEIAKIVRKYCGCAPHVTGGICIMCKAADALEALAGEIEHLTTNGIHTCHDQCQRPLCKSYRELVAAKKHGELLNKMLGEAEAERDHLKDMLEDAVKWMNGCVISGAYPAWHTNARKALGDAS